jgi:hypothetical protein
VEHAYGFNTIRNVKSSLKWMDNAEKAKADQSVILNISSMFGSSSANQQGGSLTETITKVN